MIPVGDSTRELDGEAAAAIRGFRLWERVVVFATLLAVVVGLQYLAGSFRAELTGHPDEAAHYLSGLLIRDYILAGFPEPMNYAKDFYLHYPYVALGHWPPLFYLIEGLWMLVFSASRASTLLLMACITATLGATVYSIARTTFGSGIALVTAMLCVSLPAMQMSTHMVMLDPLLAVFCLCAARSFGRFMADERSRHVWMFAAWASLAILTKVNGLSLAPMVVLALWITGRLQMFKRLDLWAAAGLVAVLCGPWHYVTRNLMLPTFGAQMGWPFVKRSVVFYSHSILDAIGAVGTIVMAVGLFGILYSSLRRRRVEPMWAALAGLALAVLLFHVIIPGGLEGRYTLAAIPPLLMFLALGVEVLSKHFKLARSAAWATVLVAFLVFTFRVPVKPNGGLAMIADRIALRPGSAVLVYSANMVGEGGLIAEIAMREERTRTTVLRTSKVLADSDWNSTYYRIPLSRADFDACLDQLDLQAFVVDRRGENLLTGEMREMLDRIDAYMSHLKLESTVGTSAAGEIRLFSVPDHPVRRDAFHRSVATLDLDLMGDRRKWPVSMHLNCETTASRR